VTGPSPIASPAYRAEDRALLLRFYQRLLWDRLLHALPPTLAPNTLTLAAEACAVLAAPVAWAASHGARPLYLLSGLLLFAYMTGDNIDGQHARRTGQTSALGELLDHGLDGLASCAVLLCSAFALHVEGVSLVVLVALGSLGFGAVFWAQYRTGLLVTPRISAMEGVTGASLLQLVAMVAGDASWLHFAPGQLNLASVLLVVLAGSYVYAIASPVLRARRAGAKLGELAAPLAIAVAAIGYSRLDAGGVALSLLVALVVAEMVCRMILQRARSQTRSFVSAAHALPLVPLAAATLGLAPADACAWAGAFVAAALYARTFAAGVRQMRSA
jgi:phosphatidylglycerophosphate synthase